MIAGLRSYSAIKNSGIGWIGEVPTHWEVTALRNRYEQCLGKMLDAKQGTGEHLMPYLRNVDVQWDRINVVDLPQIDIRPEEVERYTVRSGDLLVCEGGEVGRSAIWMGEIEQCAFQKALHRLRPQKARDRPRFLLHALRVAVEQGAFYDGHESTIGHLTGEKLRAHRFAFPPETEQRKIEAFLDHMNQRIQRYIRAKQKLITLLEEHKQTSIRQAVTGQIDVRTNSPYAAYRPSCVEWLGPVPTHWKVRKLTDVTRQETGHTPSRKVPTYWEPAECVIPWVSLGDVWQLRNGTVFVKTTKEKVSEVGLANSAARLLPKNTVILSRTASVGFAAILGVPMATTQDFAAWICGPSIRPMFLYYVLTAMKAEFRRLMIGATHQTIYMPDIRAFRTPLPTVKEQNRIARSLDDVCSVIHRRLRAAEACIDLMREYGMRLIADVVSGKLDVREATTSLPEFDALGADDEADHPRDVSNGHTSDLEYNPQ